MGNGWSIGYTVIGIILAIGIPLLLYFTENKSNNLKTTNSIFNQSNLNNQSNSSSVFNQNNSNNQSNLNNQANNRSYVSNGKEYFTLSAPAI